MHFYTDSKVVLGYIYNASKRFYVYVANRVQRIRKSTNPDQWSYVASDKNPADSATRPAPMVNMQGHRWLQDPSHLFDACSTQAEGYPLTDPDNDKEVRPSVRVSKIEVTITEALGSYRFERFSVWNDLIDTIAFLRHICSSFQGIGENVCRGWHKCTEYKNVRTLSEAEQFIIRTVQREVYSEDISLVNQKLSLPRNNPLLPLNPIMDEKGLLRVGARLNQSSLSQKDKNSIIIPGNHHIAVLLARHYHILVKHQGRHLTEGAVRSAGFWITGGKRLISSVIHKCVKCRKLRGRYETQKMADLPSVRLEPSPPFTAVGVDAFGPWLIVSRRTRGGLAQNKRWALLFTCLSSRAIHIEVIEEMSTSSFINSLRRFIAIRGNVKELRSDRGTNFIGAVDPLKADCVNVEDTKSFLNKKGIVWYFNPPHASHMNGLWVLS